MNRVAFVRLWTRSLAKNKTFVKNFVHIYFAFFTFFLKNSCSRPFFPFFLGPKTYVNRNIEPGPPDYFFTGQVSKKRIFVLKF